MTKSEEKSKKISMIIDRKKVLCYMADNNITKPQFKNLKEHEKIS